jgi:hypothetical protein
MQGHQFPAVRLNHSGLNGGAGRWPLLDFPELAWT